MKKETSMLNEVVLLINMINNYIKKVGDKQINSLSRLTVLAIYVVCLISYDPQTIKNEDVSEKNMLQCHNNLIVFQV